MLDYLPRNSRITLFLEPYSSVLACILTFYAALYMQGNGLDARQIGLITTLAAVTGLFTQFVAAPITNRFGRRRTLLVFSLICWSIPLLLWSVAAGFALFLLAAVIFSTSRITSVAWYCVATEDVSDDRKSRVFGILFIIGSVGGIATVFAGPVLDRFGLVPSLRFLYGFAFASMTLMFIVRHALLTETRAGSELNGLHAGLTLGQTFRRCLAAVTASLKDRAFLRLILAYVLFNFAAIMGFVQLLFINNVLKMTLTQISMLPPVAVIVSVVLFRFVVPRIREANERRTLVVSLVIFAASLFLLLFIPPGNLALLLIASVLGAAGSYLFQVVVNAAMNNRMGEFHKADLYSAIQLLVALITIPAGYLAGSAFAVRPQLAISLIGLVGFAAAAVILWPARLRTHASDLADDLQACEPRLGAASSAPTPGLAGDSPSSEPGTPT